MIWASRFDTLIITRQLAGYQIGFHWEPATENISHEPFTVCFFNMIRVPPVIQLSTILTFFQQVQQCLKTPGLTYYGTYH